MLGPEIRSEKVSDFEVIHAITEIAFREMPYADGDEQDVVDRLRAANALTCSLVAVVAKEVVGHIAFSPAIAGDNSHPWFALGPVSVLPGFQRRGIGSTLIVDGLAKIEDIGALGCILTGNPEYYRKFGFEEITEASNLPPYFRNLFWATRLPSGAMFLIRGTYVAFMVNQQPFSTS